MDEQSEFYLSGVQKSKHQNKNIRHSPTGEDGCFCIYD